MDFDEYLSYFEDILSNPDKHEVYKQEEYLEYAKLNFSRTKRWLSRFEPSEEMRKLINSIQEHQHWIVITEPWCGDAGHSLAQLYNIVKHNKNIDFEIQLRDSEPFLIEDYLTNGSKSIPKLIIRNDVGHDIFIWGPRPKPATELFERLKVEGVEFDKIKERLQLWYNNDKGASIQQELLEKLS